MSALWVLPTAFVFVSYLQHRKDSCDKAMALGIVKDPQVTLSIRLPFFSRGGGWDGVECGMVWRGGVSCRVVSSDIVWYDGVGGGMV